MEVEGGFLINPASLRVLCLIQVLTLVVWTWTAADGHTGRKKWLKAALFLLLLVWSEPRWQWLLRSGNGSGASYFQKPFYSPKRAGVCLGVMGTSSFLPGVQIFTALNQEREAGADKLLPVATYTTGALFLIAVFGQHWMFPTLG